MEKSKLLSLIVFSSFSIALFLSLLWILLPMALSNFYGGSLSCDSPIGNTENLRFLETNFCPLFGFIVAIISIPAACIFLFSQVGFIVLVMWKLFKSDFDLAKKTLWFLCTLLLGPIGAIIYFYYYK